MLGRYTAAMTHSRWFWSIVALVAGACLALASLLAVTRAMELKQSFDGWASAVIFGAIWAVVAQYVFVQLPARRVTENAVRIVLFELSVNYGQLAYRRSAILPTLSFAVFDAHGPTVIGALDADAGRNLVALYSLLRLYVVARPDDVGLERALAEQHDEAKDFLEGVFVGVARLKIRDDRPVKVLHDAFHAAYAAPKPKPFPKNANWLSRLLR